jgi:hypothetical protein
MACFSNMKFFCFGVLIFLLNFQSSWALNIDDLNEPQVTLSTTNSNVINLTILVKKGFLAQASSSKELKSDIASLNAKNEDLVSASTRSNESLRILQVESDLLFRLIAQLIIGLAAIFVLMFWFLWAINRQLKNLNQLSYSQKGLEKEVDEQEFNESKKSANSKSPEQVETAQSFKKERLHKFFNEEITSDRLNSSMSNPPALEDIFSKQIHSMIERRISGFMRHINSPKQ